MSTTAKISVSLPRPLVDDLDYLASRMGVSRSALIATLLGDGVADARKILEMIPPNPTPADVMRLRGQSEEVVRSRIENLKGMADDLLRK